MSRTTRLVAMALAVATVSAGLWVLGWQVGAPMLVFAGQMVGSTTFVPLPADTFVLNVSDELDPVLIGVVGGAINTAMVLVERRWLLVFVDHPSFDRFLAFFDRNRLVEWTSRNLFLGLLVGGALFIPFEPFRLVAVLKGYPVARYALATFLARGGRYYVLALAGSGLARLGFLQQALWLTLALFLFGLWRSTVRLLRPEPSPGGPEGEA